MGEVFRSTTRAIAVSLAILLVVAAVVGLVVRFTPSQATVLDPPVLIGMKSDSPGNSYLDGKTGQRSGFDYSFSQWLAAHADEPFTPAYSDVIVGTRESRLREGVDLGGVDMIISTYTITSERERQIDFAGPYLQTLQGVMVNAGDPEIKNPGQLSGKSVCAESGSTSVGELRRIPNVIVVEQPTLAQCVQDLQDERADAVSTDELLLLGVAKKEGGLRVEPNVRFGAVQAYGIGLPPTPGAENCEAVNDLVTRFVNSEEWNTAFDNNFGTGLDRNRFRPVPRECVTDDEPK